MMNEDEQKKLELENRKEACKTFVEQTKQLVSLASAFIVAPAAIQAVLRLTIDYRIIIAELAFIVSVLASYFVLASITGSQYRGDFNVYRKATMIFARIQFFSYVIGLILFIFWLTSQSSVQS